MFFMEIIELPAKRVDLKTGEESVVERVVSEKKY